MRIRRIFQMVKFRKPQINLHSQDLPPYVYFYSGLGFDISDFLFR
jgi:predicted lactoylglutathione lyase